MFFSAVATLLNNIAASHRCPMQLKMPGVKRLKQLSRLSLCVWPASTLASTKRVSLLCDIGHRWIEMNSCPISASSASTQRIWVCLFNLFNPTFDQRHLVSSAPTELRLIIIMLNHLDIHLFRASKLIFCGHRNWHTQIVQFCVRLRRATCPRSAHIHSKYCRKFNQRNLIVSHGQFKRSITPPIHKLYFINNVQSTN